jgi:hypothetical protein
MKFRNKLALASFTVTMLGTYADPVRRWMLRWGATDDEIDADLPGDACIPHPRYVTDKAVTIAAEPRHVYPWLTQLGWGRGGFYSYDRLENLMGLDLHSAEELLPADRHLGVGDILPNGPDAQTEGVWVEALEPDRAVVLRGTIVPGLPMRPGIEVTDDTPRFFDWTWAFVVVPEGPSMSRLVARLRADYRGIGSTVIRYAALEPAQFVMERKMLLGIRDRAERLAAREAAVARNATAGPAPTPSSEPTGSPGPAEPAPRPEATTRAQVAMRTRAQPAAGIGLVARTESQPARDRRHTLRKNG